MVLELELTPDAESWINTVNKGGKDFQYKWSLADCSLLARCINLDPALDSMIADRILTGEIPMPIRTWTSQQQMVTAADFNVTMTRGVSRLATVVMTYTKENGDDEKESNTLYFPADSQEAVEVQFTFGTKKVPTRPTRGCKELYYRGKQALCVSATSPHVYNMSYQNYVHDSHFQAFDTEALCGQVEFSGMNLRGGQQIFFQAKNMGHNGIPEVPATGGGAAAGGTDAIPAVPPTHPNKALLHLNYQAMLVMDSSGVTLLE